MDNAFFDHLRLALERNIAGRGFIPAGSDTNEGLMNFITAQPHCVQECPVRRPLGPLCHMPAWQPFFIENLGVHNEHNAPSN
jgi:hypothetical protein